MYLISELLFLLNVVLVIVLSRSNDSDDDFGEVVFVNVLYRHGARTPEKTYKTDPHKDAFPAGLGELTNVGKTQHYELGKWLRQRYNALLTDKYGPDLIYVLSSDKDRVLMSAQCNLAGMYPPRGDQVWNNKLNWQPIPVHTVPQTLDKVIAMKAPCPAYDKELENVLKSQEVQGLTEKYENIVKILNENTGENRDDYKYISNIYDILLVQNEHKLDLPSWSKSIFPHPMEEATILRFNLPTWNKKLARLKSGNLLQEMINNMKEKVDKKTKRNIHVYSAHDTTIANLLNTLDVYDMKLPPYAACVMLELRVSSRGAYFVTLFYRPSASEEPRLLTIPGCDAACPLEQFITITKPVIPEDWDKECQATQ